jgi:hypothetical protein
MCASLVHPFRFADAAVGPLVVCTLLGGLFVRVSHDYLRKEQPERSETGCAKTHTFTLGTCSPAPAPGSECSIAIQCCTVISTRLAGSAQLPPARCVGPILPVTGTAQHARHSAIQILPKATPISIAKRRTLCARVWCRYQEHGLFFMKGVQVALWKNMHNFQYEGLGCPDGPSCLPRQRRHELTRRDITSRLTGKG